MSGEFTVNRGRLEAIWIKRAKRGPMDSAVHATLISDQGIVGNANQGGTRQVTVIEQEVFEGLQKTLFPAIQPAMRRANLMVSGVRLEESRFRRLHIGSCVLELRGETRPCERMDEAHLGLRKALEPCWGGGANGRVVVGGKIQVGDEVWLEPSAEASAEESSASGVPLGAASRATSGTA
jgi:MOSC domain-containing protein YiiM